MADDTGRSGAIGLEVGPGEAVTVAADAIRAYADAVHDRSAVLRDVDAARAAGYADVIAPVTYAWKLATDAIMRLAESGEVGIDIGRVMHTDQRMVAVRPIVAGDRLTASARVESTRRTAGSINSVIRVDVADAAGDLVHSMFVSLVGRDVDDADGEGGGE